MHVPTMHVLYHAAAIVHFVTLIGQWAAAAPPCWYLQPLAQTPFKSPIESTSRFPASSDEHPIKYRPVALLLGLPESSVKEIFEASSQFHRRILGASTRILLNFRNPFPRQGAMRQGARRGELYTFEANSSYFKSLKLVKVTFEILLDSSQEIISEKEKTLILARLLIDLVALNEGNVVPSNPQAPDPAYLKQLDLINFSKLMDVSMDSWLDLLDSTKIPSLPRSILSETLLLLKQIHRIDSRLPAHGFLKARSLAVLVVNDFIQALSEEVIEGQLVSEAAGLLLDLMDIKTRIEIEVLNSGNNLQSEFGANHSFAHQKSKVSLADWVKQQMREHGIHTYEVLSAYSGIGYGTIIGDLKQDGRPRSIRVMGKYASFFRKDISEVLAATGVVPSGHASLERYFSGRRANPFSKWLVQNMREKNIFSFLELSKSVGFEKSTVDRHLKVPPTNLRTIRKYEQFFGSKFINPEAE